VRQLLEQNARAGSLFGAHRGSVRLAEDVDLLEPALTSNPMPKRVKKSLGD